MRAQFSRLIVNTNGAPSPVTVTVLDPDTGTESSTSFYATESASAPISFPATFTTGQVVLFADDPGRYSLRVAAPGSAERTISAIDFTSPSPEPGESLRIRSSSGTIFSITVDDNGVLTTTLGA